MKPSTLIGILSLKLCAADICQVFCVAALGVERCSRGTYCKNGNVCHSLFWTSSSKSEICYGPLCKTSLPVLCSEASLPVSTTITPTSQGSVSPTSHNHVEECLADLRVVMGSEKVIVNPADIPGAYYNVFPELLPGGMVTPTSGDEVAAVLNTALRFGIKVAVRSFAGHSYIGQSSIGSEGILMNMSRLNGFSVTTDNTAIIGAGLHLLEIYSRLAMNNPPLGLNGGTCPSVAFSGLVSGGGEGMTSSFAGITSDRLLAAKAVVWTGSAYAEIEAPSDLMFALRGGMGGNYGVVTEWKFQAFPTSSVVLFSSKISGATEAVIHQKSRQFQAWMRAQPDHAVWGMVKFISGGLVQFVGQCFCFDDSSCGRCVGIVEDLQSRVLAGTKGGYEIQPFGMAMWSWAGCTEWGGIEAYPPGGLGGITEEALHAAMKDCLDYDKGEIAGLSRKSKSLYFPDELRLDPEFEAAALRLVTTDPACNDGESKCYIQQSYVGGAMIIPNADSAFIHRTPGSHVQMTVYWNEDSRPDPYLDWANRARARLLPMSIQESYQNYPDLDLEVSEWSRLFFGSDPAVFDRLVDLKCRYNPTGILDVAQSAGGIIPTRC